MRPACILTLLAMTPLFWAPAQNTINAKMNFSPTEFREGSLAGQQGWEVVEGSAEIVGARLRIGGASQSPVHIRWSPETSFEDDLVTIDYSFRVEEFTGNERVPLARIHGIEITIGPTEEDNSRLSVLFSEGDGEWRPLPLEGMFRFDRRNDRNFYDIQVWGWFRDRPSGLI